MRQLKINWSITIVIDEHFDVRSHMDAIAFVVALRRPAFARCGASSLRRPREVIAGTFVCRSGLPVGPKTAC
jgi:hypothetical protein